MIQQQYTLNVAYTDTLEENKDIKEQVAYLKDKIKYKDSTIVQLTKEALEGGCRHSYTLGKNY